MIKDTRLNKTDQTQALVKDIQAGGKAAEEAIEQLYKNRQLRDRIIGYLVKSGCTSDRALDLYQDAILILFHKLIEDKTLEIQSAESYLFGIAKYAWLNVFKKKKEQSLGDIGDHLTPWHDTISDYYQRQDQIELMKRLLDMVGERCKTILKAFSQGYPMNEIADMIGLTNPAAMRKEKYRCLNRIRNQVKDDEELVAWIKQSLLI